jgi:hypothetical protein
LILFEEGIAESVAFLIGCGHRLRDIERYTMRQVQGFVVLARKYERSREVGMGSMMRAGFHATGKQWKEMLKELDLDGD